MNFVPAVASAQDAAPAAEITESAVRLTLESVWGLSQQPAAGSKPRIAYGGPGNDRIAARLVGSSGAAPPPTKVLLVAGGRTISALSQRAAREACSGLAPRFQGISVGLDDAADLAMHLAHHAPRLVVIDAPLCEMLGAAELRQDRRRFPAVDWLVAWEHASPRWLPILIATQARGAVEGSDPNAPLARALSAVMDGQLWFSRTVLQWMHAELLHVCAIDSFAANPQAAAARVAALSVREGAAIALMRQGLTNKEIGQHLDISVNTVKKHLAHAFEKLGLHTRRQALG